MIATSTVPKKTGARGNLCFFSGFFPETESRVWSSKNVKGTVYVRLYNRISVKIVITCIMNILCASVGTVLLVYFARIKRMYKLLVFVALQPLIMQLQLEYTHTHSQLYRIPRTATPRGIINTKLLHTIDLHTVLLLTFHSIMTKCPNTVVFERTKQ